MCVVSPLPNHLIAFDLTQPGAHVKWTYDPHVIPVAEGVACFDVINREAVYSNRKIIYNLLDTETVAVDARAGTEAWRTKLGDINHGETMTMAPIVAKGKVMVGNAGGELGVRGWLTVLDEGTGKIAWRGYTSGPDADILVGPNFKPFYPADHGVNLGVSSWPPDTRIASRVYIAGVLPNNPDNMIRWIRHPKQVDDKIAMPELNVTSSDARDIAGYLYTLQ